MSLRFVDGFDHYNTVNQFLGKWTGGNFVTPGVAGFHKQACKVVNPGNMEKTIDYQPTWTVGFRHYLASNSLSFAGARASLYTAYHNDVVLTSLVVNSNGTITITGGAGAIGTTTWKYPVNTWIYFEYSFTFTGVAPILITATLKINGTVIKKLTNVSIGVNASSLLLGVAKSNRHEFNGPIDVNVSYVLFDDLYINDGQSLFAGAPNKGFNGPITVIKIMPAADTIFSGWIPDTGTAHFSRVNEIPPDDDASYVHGTDTTANDLWIWEQIANIPIKGIQISMYARKDDEGSKAFITNAANQALAVTTNSPVFWVDDQYTYYSWTLDGDNSTGKAWTAFSLNTSRFGPQITN